MIRLIILSLAMVMGEAAYAMMAGKANYYFSPLLGLQISAFLGLLIGPRRALWWAAATGLLEDFYFASPQTSLGLTPIVYLWIAWSAGRLSYGRADAANPLMAMVISGFAFITGIVGGKILAAIFSTALIIIPNSIGWKESFSLSAQILMSPILLVLLGRWMEPSMNHR